MSVSIGADPEFFVQVDGVPTPICDLIGGTKARPKDLGDGYAVQEDNVMVEFNIAPSDNPRTFQRRVLRGIELAMLEVRKALPGAEIYREASFKFPHSALTSPKAQRFGCSADNNGYASGAKLEPFRSEMFDSEDGSWRFAGGHIHLGYDAEVPAFVAAQFADLFLASTWMYIPETERDAYYGTPGRFRPKPYGIEYRSLSNYWLFDRDALSFAASGAWNAAYWFESTDIDEIRRVYQEMPWADLEAGLSKRDGNLVRDIRRYASEKFSVNC